MNVVGHQNVGVNSKLIAFRVVFGALELMQPITVVAKDLLPLIATDDDVIEPPFNSTRGFLAMPATVSGG